MSSPSIVDSEGTRLSQLAGVLERDIQRRGLRPGEPYLTAIDVSKLLGVSRMTANRAMNLLANRKLLVRHRSRGTFIGPIGGSVTDQKAECVHYFAFRDDNPDQQLPAGQILGGLQSLFPEINLKTHILPLNMTIQQFRRELDAIAYASNAVGVIMTLGSREIQQALVESRLPAVVHGSVYPGIQLPSLEVDQEQTGRLMAELAIRQGHRRLVFVGRELSRRGDNLALDGIQQAAGAAGLETASVMVRNLSADMHAIRFEAEEIVSTVSRPAAFLCRLPHFAGAIVEAAERLGLGVPDQVGVVYDHTSEGGLPPFPYPCVRSEYNIQEQMRLLAQMFQALSNGQLPEPYRVVVPVMCLDV